MKKAIVKAVIFLLVPIFFMIFFLKRGDQRPLKPARGKQIKSLGYLTWVPAERTMGKKGVTSHIQDESFPGLNLYNSRDQSSAYLMDMNGHKVHRWKNPLKGIYSWHHVEACANGDLIVIIRDQALMRLNWNSRLKWVCRMRFHHDVSMGENGDLFAVASKEQFIRRKGFPFPIITDYIVVLSASGEIKREIPVYPLVGDQIPDEKFSAIYKWLGDPGVLIRCQQRKREKGYYLPAGKPPDILHTNSIEVMGRDMVGLCHKGDLLISMRELDMIAFVDMDQQKLHWSWGPGILEKQHHPRFLENGNILVFDNGEPERKYSRVLEINPLSGKVVWSYQATSPRDFFSLSRGGSQRLPNGNTLITESDRGRVFEINSWGKTVWEFYNPRIQSKTRRRAAIYRMIRLWNFNRYPFLKKFDVH